MKFRLTRLTLDPSYTIGKLEVWKDNTWAYLCDTLEDTVRDVNKNGVFDNGEKKIKEETAIPYGTYGITMNVQSPKYSNYDKYPYARVYRGYMPRLVNVPHFDGILIHPGATTKSTAGCILVGRHLQEGGRITDSQMCWHSLMQTYLIPAKKNKEPITIEIV